jgi:hypothetical protein
MQSNIHANVMRRVHTIHAVRPFMSGTAFAAVLAVGSLYVIGRNVWFAHVVANFNTVLANGNVARFLLVAFLNTRTIVQVLCVAVLFSFAWIVRDLLRSLPTFRFA